MGQVGDCICKWHAARAQMFSVTCAVMANVHCNQSRCGPLHTAVVEMHGGANCFMRSFIMQVECSCNSCPVVSCHMMYMVVMSALW